MIHNGRIADYAVPEDSRRRYHHFGGKWPREARKARQLSVIRSVMEEGVCDDLLDFQHRCRNGRNTGVIMQETVPFPFADPETASMLTRFGATLCPDDRASVLIVADREERDALGAIATCAGGRVLDHVRVAHAMARLDRICDVDLVVLCVTAWDPAWPVLLVRLDTMAAAGDVALVVVTDIACLDQADAHVKSPLVQWVCDPSATDLAAAIATGLRARTVDYRLRDIGGDGDSDRLDRLSEEVDRLARILDALTENGFAGRTPSPDRGGGPWLAERQGGYVGQPIATFIDTARDELCAGHVRELLRARRLRDQFLPGDLFADPAWDMLLDLMAARLSGERVSVSSLCIAAAVPPTTALRWIRHLTERGIFLRENDPADGRRVFIVLSDEASASVTRWFTARRRVLGDTAG